MRAQKLWLGYVVCEKNLFSRKTTVKFLMITTRKTIILISRHSWENINFYICSF